MRQLRGGLKTASPHLFDRFFPQARGILFAIFGLIRESVSNCRVQYRRLF